jgi:hypothetical protein
VAICRARAAPACRRGLTATLVWCFVSLGLSAIAAKVVATPVVLAWNYLGRRLFVFRADMPIGIWRVSAQVLASARAAIPRSDPSESAKFKIAPSAMRNERMEMLGLRERYRENTEPIVTRSRTSDCFDARSLQTRWSSAALQLHRPAVGSIVTKSW